MNVFAGRHYYRLSKVKSHLTSSRVQTSLFLVKIIPLMVSDMNQYQGLAHGSIPTNNKNRVLN